MIRLFQRLTKSVRTSPRFLRWPLLSLYWLPIGIVFDQYMYTMRVVTGSSMQPALNPESSYLKDAVIFDRLSIWVKRKYVRGDIVALKHPTTQNLIVKRIIALEGDVVETLPPYPDLQVVVPPGHAWVEGDESFKSEDSNRFGPIPLALINSRLIFIVWPLRRFGAVEHQNFSRVDTGKRLKSVATKQEMWWASRVKPQQ